MDIREFLLHHGIDFREGGTHQHVRPGWIGVDCPRCGPKSGKFHAGIREDFSRASCWQCGGLRVFDLLAELAGIPWHQVREMLGSAPVRLASSRSDPRAGGRLKTPAGVGPLLGPHRRYLQRRGFDPDEIARIWGVQGIGPLGPLAWRLWLPITLNGEVVSWTTRAVGKSSRRYLSAAPKQEIVDHKTLLYGEDLAGAAIVVVEGPVDAWAIGPGAVATMGLMTTPEQIARIAAHPLRAICCDAEPAARRRAERMADLLQCCPGDTHVIDLETGKDPAEADPDELQEIRDNFLSFTGSN